MRTCFAAFFAAIILCSPAMAEPETTHGLSLYSSKDLKYAPGQPYDYANPSAPKGGSLTLTDLGTFTKLNYYSLKGLAAPEIQYLVWETLVEGSDDPDEFFSQYGRIVDRFELAKDRMSITYHLNKKAAFSDGVPLTADDVVFSFNLIQDPEYVPFYRSYFGDVKSCDKLDAHTVRFTFNILNQELPLVVGQLAILPKHIYGVPGKSFGSDFDEIAVGSGPYTVESFDKSKYITYKRNPNYWGKDLPVNKGRFNFDTITYKVFLSPVPRREALKGGIVDAEYINSSKDWAKEYNGDFVQKGYMNKVSIPNNRVQGMQGFVFNLRNPLFQDINVRKAMAAVFDFEYMNENLFYGQYKRQTCYFDNNKELLSRGPAKGKVREVLFDLHKKHNRNKNGTIHIPIDALRVGPRNIGELPDGSMLPIGERVNMANKLLDDLGWKYDEAKGVRSKDGLDMAFKFLLYDEGFIRIVNPFVERLKEIGVKCDYLKVQPAEYVKKLKDFEFDMVTYSFPLGLSPGNEQRDYWTSKAADIPGTRNFIGIKNPAVDDVVERLVRANTREDLVAYVRALDRILSANHYVIPHWFIDYDRGVHWQRISGPEKHSEIYFFRNVYHWWWYDEAKAKALEEAKEKGVPFEWK